VGGHGAEIPREGEGVEQPRIRLPAGGPLPRRRGGVYAGAPPRSRVRARPGEPKGNESEIEDSRFPRFPRRPRPPRRRSRSLRSGGMSTSPWTGKRGRCRGSGGRRPAGRCRRPRRRGTSGSLLVDPLERPGPPLEDPQRHRVSGPSRYCLLHDADQADLCPLGY
jgi:hypothetical protein